MDGYFGEKTGWIGQPHGAYGGSVHRMEDGLAFVWMRCVYHRLYEIREDHAGCFIPVALCSDAGGRTGTCPKENHQIYYGYRPFDEQTGPGQKTELQGGNPAG